MTNKQLIKKLLKIVKTLDKNKNLNRVKIADLAYSLDYLVDLAKDRLDPE